MKQLLLALLLFPFYTIACSCDPPPVALEFLRAKYIFWGSVIEKEYAADSLTYTATFKVDKSFKENKENSQILTFTMAAEGEFTGSYSSCDFNVNKGENWLIYAYDYKGKLTFSYYCSNSKPYRSFTDVRKEELEIIEAGDRIDVNKIIFESTASRLWSMKEYEAPEPKIPFDSLLAQLDSKYYSGLGKADFENFIINVDTKGKLTVVAVHRKHKNWEIKRIYGVSYSVYTSLDSLNTTLQNEMIRKIKKSKTWKPATFMGRAVNSQVHLQVYFEKDKKPQASRLF